MSTFEFLFVELLLLWAVSVQYNLWCLFVELLLLWAVHISVRVSLGLLLLKEVLFAV
jgi:hypothetical protein